MFDYLIFKIKRYALTVKKRVKGNSRYVKVRRKLNFNMNVMSSWNNTIYLNVQLYFKIEIRDGRQQNSELLVRNIHGTIDIGRCDINKHLNVNSLTITNT